MPSRPPIHLATVSVAFIGAMSCGPSHSPVSTEGATGSTGTSEGSSSSSSSSSEGNSETSSMLPDAGPSLPEGCADGVPESGQFCFELVSLFDRRPRDAVAFDLDADGTDELLVGFDRPAC